MARHTILPATFGGAPLAPSLARCIWGDQAFFAGEGQRGLVIGKHLPVLIRAKSMRTARVLRRLHPAQNARVRTDDSEAGHWFLSTAQVPPKSAASRPYHVRVVVHSRYG